MGKKAIAGVSDVATLMPALAELFHGDSPLGPQEVTPHSNRKALFACPQGHAWLARVATVAAGGRCTYCANLAVLSGFNDLATRHPELLPSYSDKNPQAPQEVLASGARKLLWECNSCGGSWKAQARQRAAGTGCPYCSSARLLPGFNDFATRFPALAKLYWSEANSLTASEVLPFSNRKYYFTCHHHGDWLSTPNRIASGGGCPSCRKFTSKGERELRSYLESLGLTVLANERKLLEGKEIDCYLPSLALGLEYNGTYWHSDALLLALQGVTAEEWHRRKREAALQAGVQLYFLWEDDWRERQEQVKEELVKVLLHRNPPSKLLTTLTKG